MELTATKGVAPTFLLLPPSPPAATLFATWHAEPISTAPAAVEGAERLALAATLVALEGLAHTRVAADRRGPRVALVVAPAGTTGSLPLAAVLEEHRERLRAGSAFWMRLGEPRRRRRVFLGSRGRVVVAIWSGEGNPYRLRDRLIEELTEGAFGPRPLDFELLRKAASAPETLDFLRQILPDEGAAAGPSSAEEALRRALFDPRGSVACPSASHPERPRAWITIETAESMEGAAILERLRAWEPAGKVERVEDFPWDRHNIHHPSVQALIALAKTRSEGPEIWPMSPWPTPSGVFTRALGVGLAEWTLDLPAGTRIRFPSAEQLESIAREVAEGIALLSEGDPPAPAPS